MIIDAGHLSLCCVIDGACASETKVGGARLLAHATREDEDSKNVADRVLANCRIT